MRKVISFDVDGTLIDLAFNDLIWLEEIPRLYAEKKGMDFEDARRFVIGEYEKVGEKDLRWYDMDYWLRVFKLGKGAGEILEANEENIRVYSDARKVLEALKEKFSMIVITLMPRKFLDIKLKKLDGYFSAAFSTVSDFGSLKTSSVYEMICDKLGIGREELLHVGDSWEMDYIEPRKAGINAFYIDRDGEKGGEGVIKSLEELLPVISED